MWGDGSVADKALLYKKDNVSLNPQDHITLVTTVHLSNPSAPKAGLETETEEFPEASCSATLLHAFR